MMWILKKFESLLKLKFTTQLCGIDSYGNKYFESKKHDDFGRKKRFCIYSGYPEASKLPNQYHMWMHHQTNVFPSNNVRSSHIPDITGTKYVLHSQNDVYGTKYSKGNKNPYEAWNV